MYHDEIYSNLRNTYFDLLTLNFQENDRKEQFQYLARGLKDYINHKYKESEIEKNFGLMFKNLEKIISITEKISSNHEKIQKGLCETRKNQKEIDKSLKKAKGTINYMKKIEEEKRDNEKKSGLN